MFKPRSIQKIARYFLLIGNIDGIDLCMAGIEVHPYFYPVSYFGQFNILKTVLYMEKSDVGQQTIFSKNVKS